MNLTCLLGRHWPIAAFGRHREGFQLSRCVDCGWPMMKADGVSWRALPRTVVRRARAG